MSKIEKNRYGVSKGQWNRWSEHARDVFNKLYWVMRRQKAFDHPDTELLPQDQWDTVRWNAAWMAAEFAQKHAHFAAMTGIRALGAIALGLQKSKHNKRERMNIGRAVQDLGKVVKAGEINRV